jgi:hypothetical protein
MAKWYLLIDGRETGPLEPTELKQLAATARLKPTDKVRREDMREWRGASEVKGLFGAASATSPSQHTATVTATPPTSDGFATSSSNGNGATRNATPNFGEATGATSRDHSTRASDGIRGQVSSVWADLRGLNFWEEIVPIDATNIRRMLTDPVILAVFVAGIGPLLFVTLGKPEYQRYAFSLLFAFLWVSLQELHYSSNCSHLDLGSVKCVHGNGWHVASVGIQPLLCVYRRELECCDFALRMSFRGGNLRGSLQNLTGDRVSALEATRCGSEGMHPNRRFLWIGLCSLRK